MKRIKLSERDPVTGRIVKNESYTHGELHDLIYKRNKDFFRHPLLGAIRRKAMSVVFITMARLTDLDVKGQGRVFIREPKRQP